MHLVLNEETKALPFHLSTTLMMRGAVRWALLTKSLVVHDTLLVHGAQRERIVEDIFALPRVFDIIVANKGCVVKDEILRPGRRHSRADDTGDLN